jgi:hypothetical protein
MGDLDTLKDEIVKTLKGGFYRAHDPHTIFHTCLFYYLAYVQGVYNHQDADRLASAMNKLRRFDSLGLEIRGLYANMPPKISERWDRYMNHPDNYMALAALVGIGISEHAVNINLYGEENHFNFNNVHPERKDLPTQHGVFSIFFYRAVIDKPLGFLGVLGLVCYMMRSLFYLISTNHVCRYTLLDFMRIHALKSKWYIVPIRKLFNYYLKSAGGFEKVMRAYYANTLLARFAQGIHQI